MKKRNIGVRNMQSRGMSVCVRWRLCFVAVVAFVMCGCGKSYVAQEINIVPEPVSVTTKARSFTLSNHTTVCFMNLGQNSKTAKYVSKAFRQMRFHLKLSGRQRSNSILFIINDTTDSVIGEEGYRLDIRPSGITVSANTEKGLFYGYQTLAQMMPDDIYKVRYSKVTLPECTIVDYPQYGWRGCHLDVSRHFFGTKQVKRILDLMATYKMNKFHWHLTDDHGWRLESEHYPLLNSIGSWRASRKGLPWTDCEPPSTGEPQTYGGYYTREDVADIVNYAAQLNIDVIPEIDVPGHVSALLAAYPQMGCSADEGYMVQTGPYWPPMAVLCAGNDSAMAMIKGILDEVVSMFPYEYVHIGGNEVVCDEWEMCSKCQARMRSLHLTQEVQLHDWIVGELRSHLAEKGRKIIGWEEIGDGELGDDDIVMAWRGMQGGITAASEGHYTVMTPSEYCFFDSYQANPKYQPQAIGQPLTLEKVYSFSPLMKELPPEQAKYVLGGQCELWTEYIDNWSHAEYMLMPRLCAMAEALWTPDERKDWPRFRHKTVHQKLRMEASECGYCEGSFKPSVKISQQQADMFHVTVSSEVEGTYVYYTLDGTLPTLESPTYVEPLTLKAGTTLRLRSVFNGLPQEEVYDYVIR